MKKLPFSLFILALLTSTFSIFGQTGHLVISQVYGGGGNAGGVYANDFIELYNPTSGPLSTAGLSVQYASTTGNFSVTNSASLDAATIPAGGYYLIEAAPGANTAETALPTPDSLATNLNLSGTGGKVALVSTLITTSGCPLPNASVTDLVGWGTATCFEGSGPAPTTTNSTGVMRNAGADTDNNAADFTAGTPVAHNSSFGAPTNMLSAIGSANPSSVNASQQVVLTVTVTPALSPASTNIAVTGDLSNIGGLATQAFVDSGDGLTFNFTANVNTTTDGNITLPITVTDAESHSAATSISITVVQPTPTIAISTIQGQRSTTAMMVSPYAGQKVTTTGVVTAVLSNGFFIQSQTPDGDPLTPEGIEVFTSSKPPAAAALGNLVSVTGTVSTYPAVTASHTPASEISGSPSVALVQANVPLPAPVTLTAVMLTASGGLYQLTPYEGMRVSIASMTTVSGTQGPSLSGTNENNEMASSYGYFYGVIGNTARPFREPGIDIRDSFTPLPAHVTHFDDNPERILIDSTLAGGTSLELSTGAVLPNVTGVLDFTFSSDQYYDPSRLILDASYDRSQVVAGMAPQPLPVANANQFTVASFNIERFFNTSSADNIYYIPSGVNLYNSSGNVSGTSTGQTGNSSAATLTPAAYQRRLQKLSLAIRTILNNPDIVTLEEVENQSVANDIANQINTDAGSTLYTAISTDNATYYTQDGTGISVGFLIKNTVDNLGFTQIGQNETLSNGTITLNDRPWLALSAGIKRGTGKDYPVTVIVNHMRSLSGIGDNTQSGINTRTKKELQAEDIAKYIQTLQAAGKHVISGGDFNAFEFSDGYTDTLATYTNTNILPADQVVQPGVANLVTPSLVDLALNLAPTDRWSYVEDGSAQILDHMIVTPELAANAQLVYAHIDADFPLTAYNDATTPARSSDHDPAVGYFTLPAPVQSAKLAPASADFGSNALGIPSIGQVFTLTNTGDLPVSVTSVKASGDFAATSACGTSLDTTTATCTINVVFTATATGARTGILTVVTSAGTYTSQLTGTGRSSDFTIGGPGGNTTTAVTVAAGSPANVALTFTPNGGTATITLTCVSPNPAPTGTTCTVPAPFTINGTTPVTQTITISTTTRVATSGLAAFAWRQSPWTTLGIFGLAGLLMFLATRSRQLGKSTVRITSLLALLLAVCLPVIGCSDNPKTTTSGGTPAGTYAYTVTATSNTGAIHIQTINLTVQ